MFIDTKRGDSAHPTYSKRRRSCGAVKAGEIPAALQNFDSLPNSALVRIGVVAALFGFSESTVWRQTKAGTFPAPRHLGKRVTAWNVGELRAALANNQGAAHNG